MVLTAATVVLLLLSPSLPVEVELATVAVVDPLMMVVEEVDIVVVLEPFASVALTPAVRAPTKSEITVVKCIVNR